MAKRLTDTAKYRKRFMRSLPGPYKTLWDFLYVECDHAGIWEVDIEAARFYTGFNDITEEQALSLFNNNQKRIIPFNDGDKWFIVGFPMFQYGNKEGVLKLNPANTVHSSVISLLKKYNLLKYIDCKIAPLKPLKRDSQGDKDKDKDKDRDKDSLSLDFDVSVDFESLWSLFPNKVGKEAARRKSVQHVKTPADLEAFKLALSNYKKVLQDTGRICMDGSTFFNGDKKSEKGWRNWVERPDIQSKPAPRLPDAERDNLIRERRVNSESINRWKENIDMYDGPEQQRRQRAIAAAEAEIAKINNQLGEG
jgi:hypothetical protein